MLKIIQTDTAPNHKLGAVSVFYCVATAGYKAASKPYRARKAKKRSARAIVTQS